jgi:hypothetical protein
MVCSCHLFYCKSSKFNFPLQGVHCGCIVSIQTFTLLDAGGIECMACERKSFVLVRANSSLTAES